MSKADDLNILMKRATSLLLRCLLEDAEDFLQIQNGRLSRSAMCGFLVVFILLYATIGVWVCQHTQEIPSYKGDARGKVDSTSALVRLTILMGVLSVWVGSQPSSANKWMRLSTVQN